MSILCSIERRHSFSAHYGAQLARLFSPSFFARQEARVISSLVNLLRSSGISFERHSGWYWNIKLSRVSVPSFPPIQCRMGATQQSKCPGNTNTRIISSPCFLASRWLRVHRSQYMGASEILAAQSRGPYLKSKR